MRRHLAFVLYPLFFSSSIYAQYISCQYNGVEYSQGSVICQAGLKFVCNDSIWIEKGGDCVNEMVYEEFVINEDGEYEENILNDITLTKEISNAYHCEKGGNVGRVTPDIEIKNRQITVNHRVEGILRDVHIWTVLKSKSRKFVLRKGKHIVEPGKYTHTLVVRYSGNRPFCFYSIVTH